MRRCHSIRNSRTNISVACPPIPVICYARRNAIYRVTYFILSAVLLSALLWPVYTYNERSKYQSAMFLAMYTYVCVSYRFSRVSLKSCTFLRPNDKRSPPSVKRSDGSTIDFRARERMCRMFEITSDCGVTQTTCTSTAASHATCNA